MLCGERDARVDPKILVKVDYWVGRPLCAVLTLFRRVFGRKGARVGPPRKILFIKFEEQGALVLAADAFRRAAALVGEENVYCCLFEKNRPILDLLGMLRPENVLTIDTRGPWAALWGAWAVLRKARRLGIDAIVDMEGFARMSAAFAFLCGGSRRVGVHRFTGEGPYRGDLMTHRIAYSPYVHAANHFSALVEALSMDPAAAPMLKAPPPEVRWEAPRFSPGRDLVARVEAMLPPGGAPLFIFTPNSSDVLRLRKWAMENYVALGRSLLGQLPGARIVFTGLESERDVCGEAAAALGLPASANLAGRLTLDELCALFTLGDVLITNDSGPGHFAAMTPIHQVVLFGPETPRLYGPLGARTRVLYKGTACSPCLTAFNHRVSACQDNVCIQMITVDEVLEEVGACLRERQQTGAVA